MTSATSRKRPAPRALSRKALSAGSGIAFVALLVVAGCRRDSTPGGTASANGAASAALPRDAGAERLPEDPVLARKATEQWREHLVEEERERKQMFDRAHRAEHGVVLSAIDAARARYDFAKTKAKVKEAEARFQASLPALEKKVAAIDPQRQSSNLLEDYASMLAALDGPYPAARLAALDGDAKAADKLASDLERRLAKARSWLGGEEHEEHEGSREKR